MISLANVCSENGDLRLSFNIHDQTIDALSAALQTLGCAETERGLGNARLEQMPLVVDLSHAENSILVSVRLLGGATNLKSDVR